jgi:hypothetical protein
MSLNARLERLLWLKLVVGVDLHILREIRHLLYCPLHAYARSNAAKSAADYGIAKYVNIFPSDELAVHKLSMNG